VREVQERRAREAALERAEKEQRYKDEAAGSPPQLELLPQADVEPVNPLVSAALRRIERAHQQAPQSVGHATQAPAVAALACTADNDFCDEVLQGPESSGALAAVDLEELVDVAPETEPSPGDKVHNLVVVPSRVTNSEKLEARPKPRRMIADDANDPALNYLDSVPTTLRVEAVGRNHAPAISRLLGAIVDLFVVAFLCAPFAAVVELANVSWQNWRMAAIGVTVFLIVSFLYSTISTALTGRTLGTRLFSLRIVDARTGLIPTGKQSAGRALVYLATLMTLGLMSLYALVDSDKRTAHDRLTRTAVVEG
jgi:uncharacterized RDD family membrane protein YckC